MWNYLAGSSYIKLPKELHHPNQKKRLINIQNIQNIDDNECFKWCLLRYLNPADHHPAKITKAKTLDFKDTNIPLKIRDIHKIEKKNSIGISIFGYENKEKYPLYLSKKYCKEKHVDLLLIGEGEKNTTFLSMISIDSCTIIHYIVEENIFAFIVYMLSLKKKY